MVADGRQRIDKWLFFARVVKSRSLAAKLVQAGRVRVNRDKIDTAAHPLKTGDVLTITLERQVLVYRVLAPGTRRGPADEAKLLYENMAAPKPAATAEDPQPVERDVGSGRPTKRDRRLTDRLRDLS